MVTAPVYEAKTRVSKLLRQAQQGQEITITRRGVPVARLMPPAPSGADVAGMQRREVAAAFETLAALRRGATLDVPLRQAIEQGRD